MTIFEEMKRRWDVGEKRRGEEKGEGEKEREREGRRIVRGSKVRKMNYVLNHIFWHFFMLPFASYTRHFEIKSDGLFNDRSQYGQWASIC